MDTTNTAATRGITGAKSVDLRTSSMRALDDTAAWLRGHVPDRFPADADPLVLANPSMLSAIAGELARRLTAELRLDDSGQTRDGFLGERGLEPLIARLPAALLTFNPSEAELGNLRRQIDEHVHALRNPPAPSQLPAEWIVAARELGIALPIAKSRRDEARVRAEAEEMIHTEYARRLTDKHLQPIARLFRRNAIEGFASSYAGGPRSIEAKRARHALAAIQVLPAVDPSSPFAATDQELRATADFVASPTPSVRCGGGLAPKLDEQYSPTAEIVGAEPPSYYGPLVLSAGEPMPQLERFHSYRAQYEEIRDKWRTQPPHVPQAARDDRERAFVEAMQPVLEAQRARLSKLAADWRTAFEDQRRRLVAAFDATLATMPIGPAWFHTRNARDVVATNAPTDDGSIAMMQSYGVRIEVRR